MAQMTFEVYGAQVPVTSVALLEDHEGYLWAGGYPGYLYKSDNANGAPTGWSQANVGWPSSSWSSIEQDLSNNYMYFASFDNGVYRWDRSNLTLWNGTMTNIHQLALNQTTGDLYMIRTIYGTYKTTRISSTAVLVADHPSDATEYMSALDMDSEGTLWASSYDQPPGTGGRIFKLVAGSWADQSKPDVRYGFGSTAPGDWLYVLDRDGGGSPMHQFNMSTGAYRAQTTNLPSSGYPYISPSGVLYVLCNQTIYKISVGRHARGRCQILGDVQIGVAA